MSRSGHFLESNPSLNSKDGSMEFVARVHCMIKPFVVRDSIASTPSTPNCRSGRQKWLLSCANVCLVTLTLQQPIVTKKGCNVDLIRVLFLAVAMRLRINCFDDLFVPTDMVWFPFSFPLCSAWPIITLIAV